MSRALIGFVVSRYADVRERDAHADLSPTTRPRNSSISTWPFVMGVKRFASLNLLIAQRPEGSAQLLAEDLRLFPSGEVAALISLVPVDEVAEGTLPPNSRWSVDLAGKYSDRDR